MNKQMHIMKMTPVLVETREFFGPLTLAQLSFVYSWHWKKLSERHRSQMPYSWRTAMHL